jgi:DNA repair and recombination protein RAD54B
MVKKVNAPAGIGHRANIQSEQAKRDKLSALKKWKHLDPHERSSFDTMSDTLLHGLIYSEWESTKFSKAAKEEEDEMDGIESANSQDEIDVRDRSSGSSSNSKKDIKKQKTKKRVDIGGLETKRKYDLNVIANSGGGGKVMYMFEKVSKSKMLDKTEV